MHMESKQVITRDSRLARDRVAAIANDFTLAW